MYPLLYNKTVISITLLLYAAVIIAVSHIPFKDGGVGFLKINDKIMHISEYFLLGIFLFRFFYFVKGKTQKASYFLTFAYGTAFAVSDELHQGFVGYFDSGVFGGVRNPDFFDVSADVAGIAVAMLILHTISKCQKTNKLYTGTK